MWMRPPRRRSRTSWSSMTGPCWLPIHVAASPRSSVDLELALATRSPTVNPCVHFHNKLEEQRKQICDFIYWLALFHGYHPWLLSSYNCSTDLFWLLGTCSHFLFTIAQVHSISGKQYHRRLPMCSCICFCWQSLVLVMLLNLNHGSHIR